MIFNSKKTDRQNLCLYRYKNTDYKGQRRGIILASTGFGKTFIGILRILEINSENPDGIINVVVPKIKLKEDWTKEGGHIDTHGLTNVRVYVVNSYIKEVMPTCDFLLLDECHRYAGEDSMYFSTVVDITTFRESLALSATLSTREIEFMMKKGFKVVDTITDEESEREGYVTPSLVFNLGLELDEEERETYNLLDGNFGYYAEKFNHNYDVAKACMGRNNEVFTVETNDGGFKTVRTFTGEQWRFEWAKERGWKGEQEHEFHPNKIRDYAQYLNEATVKRKNFLYNSAVKLRACQALVKAFPHMKTLIFSESSKFANEAAKQIEGCKPYHSYVPSEVRREGQVIADSVKIKQGRKETTYYVARKSGKPFTMKQIKGVYADAKLFGVATILKETIKAFEEDSVNVLSTVKKLDEGINIEAINLVIIASYTSSERQQKQRKGRGMRIDPAQPNKRAIIINLYIKDTQEERAWLKKANKNTKQAIKVETIKEIIDFINNPWVVKQNTFDMSSI